MYARLGSGSACRSLYGGLVQWRRGFEEQSELKNQLQEVSKRAVASKVEIKNLPFWFNNLRILICVVKPDAGQNIFKDVPSTSGMKLSLQTSELLRLRLRENLASQHIEKLKEAMAAKDF